MENRHVLAVNGGITQATGRAEAECRCFGKLVRKRTLAVAGKGEGEHEQADQRAVAQADPRSRCC